MLRKVHADPKSNGTKNAAEEDIWGGKNFLDFVKLQNGKQRYNQKTEHFEDPLCADPISAPKNIKIQFSSTCFRPARPIFSKRVRRQFFTITSITTMPQVLSFQDMFGVQYSNGMTLSTRYSILSQRVRSLQRSTSRSTQRLDYLNHKKKTTSVWSLKSLNF